MDNLEQTDVVSSIKRTLTCQICQNLFVDPRILPCLHTFCCQCVESLVRNRPLKDKTLKCPTCQLETELDSRASARTLPANSLLVSMLDFLLIQEGKTIGCDICDDSEESLANVRCRECSLYLCGLHEEAHKRARDTKLHVLLNLEHLKTMSLKELNRPCFCIVHLKERLALFCNTCNKSICRNCALSDHKRHDTKFLQEVYSKLTPNLSVLLDHTKSVCIKVENAIPVIDWMFARINLKADNVLRDIDDSFNAKIKALEMRRSKLKSAVELVRINRKTSLEMQKRKLKASRDTLRVSCNFVKRVLEEGDPVYLLSAKDIMSKRLESLVNQNYELHPREDHAISFSADEKMLQEMIDSFGCIDDNYAHYSTTKAEGRGLREARLNQPAYFTIVTRDRKGRPITCETSDVIVQIQAPDETVIVADVSIQSTGKHSIGYTPSVPGPHLIQVTIRGFPMKGSPFAVFVPCETRDYKDMNEPQLIIGSPGEEPGQLKGARGITVDKDNRIIVCDTDNFRVQVFVASGEFHFGFGKKGKNKGEFQNGPQNVAVSEDGEMFVCDFNGTSVQVFNSKGEFLKKLTTPIDAEPCGKFSHVATSNDGSVYVADCEKGVIYAFDSSGEYLTHFKAGCLDENDGLQGRLHGIATNNRGEIIVSLAKDVGFRVLNKDGNLLREIKLPLEERNSLFATEAIALDLNDNIVMVDSMRNCLLIFAAEDGHLIAECARDSLCNPLGVAVDRMGRLIISDSSNQIKVF